jgi:DNA-binding Lrp family transcriptional regulator
MSSRVLWNDDRDLKLLRLRDAGHSWDAIAMALGLSPNAVRERGRRIGARRAPRPKVIRLVVDPDRPALPPGHPRSWGVLVAGTVLEDEPYPRQMPMGSVSRGVIGELC